MEKNGPSEKVSLQNDGGTTEILQRVRWPHCCW